jgi:hypothetical protein
VTFDINNGSYQLETEGYTKSLNVFTADEGSAANIVVFKFTATTQINSITVEYCDVEVANNVMVQFAASGYASYCSPFALDLTPTEEYAAWAVTAVNGTEVTFSKILGAVPAGTPFILYGKEMGGEIVSLHVATGETTAVDDNMLRGTLAPTYVETVEGDYTNFALSKGAFAKMNTGTVKANKAFLPVLTENLPSDGGARLMIVFAEDGIVTDVVKNIRRDGDSNMHYYNLKGQRVDNPTEGGLYIVNGQKVVVK